MIAARVGKRGSVQALIDAKVDVNERERKGQTALMWASAEGHAEVVELLLAAKADHQIALSSGMTALFFAAREGRRDVVRHLIRAGADPNAELSPPKGASRAARAGTSPLILAIENGHFEVALELLEAKADPNDQRTGFTPLHTLTWVRKPNRGDGEDGDPPPAGSGRIDSLEFARILKQHGADVNLGLTKGATSKVSSARKG